MLESKIVNYETVSNIIKKHFKRGVYTNFFLNEEEINDEINGGTLYIYENDYGLIILRDRISHYILNYYINDIQNMIIPNFSKVVVTEVATKMIDDGYNKIIDFFKNNNMNICKKRIRMVRKSCENVYENMTNNIKICTDEFLDEALEFLNGSFDKYTGCIPNYISFEKDIKNNDVYIFLDDKIRGILHMKKSKNSSEIKHLAVDKNYRRNKIASSLVEKYFNDDGAKTKSVWLDEKNIIAKNFYSSVGYEVDDYVSTVFVKM